MDRGALQQEYLKRRKLNTFQERRKEGRTAYTKASRTAIIVGSLGLIFNIMAIVLPNWRSSWVGLIGYGTRRNWGLLYVQGHQTTFHHTMYDNNCKWYGHLMLGNSCLSPICRWYLLKCNSYFELCLYSYSAALGIIIGTIVQTLCLYWTVLLTTRTLRWAANWWPVAAMLNIAGTVFWIIMTEGIFEELNEESWYPVPPPGLSFVLACASAVLQLVNAFLGYTLHYMWPEVDPDNPDQFDSGTDSEDEDAEELDPDEKQGGYWGYDGYGGYGGGDAAADGGISAQSPSASPERQWYYKDSYGQVQGPFPTSKMQEWVGAGHLGAQIEARAIDETDFSPIGDGSRIV